MPGQQAGLQKMSGESCLRFPSCSFGSQSALPAMLIVRGSAAEAGAGAGAAWASARSAARTTNEGVIEMWRRGVWLRNSRLRVRLRIRERGEVRATAHKLSPCQGLIEGRLLGPSIRCEFHSLEPAEPPRPREPGQLRSPLAQLLPSGHTQSSLASAWEPVISSLQTMIESPLAQLTGRLHPWTALMRHFPVAFLGALAEQV